MSDRNSPPLPSPGATDRRRRSSITGQTFADLFGRSSQGSGQTNGTTPAYPGPITSAAAQAQRRRLSLTTVGLSGSPNQSSPFTAGGGGGGNGGRPRRESFSSGTSGSVDESPFEDTDGPPTAGHPTTPFARRLSSGVQALRDSRAGGAPGNGQSNGRSSADKVAQSPPPHSAKSREGFNFAENMRSRASRASISGPSGGMPSSPPQSHHRTQSVATLEPPVKEMPKQPKRPDAFQERILKGDFYMD